MRAAEVNRIQSILRSRNASRTLRADRRVTAVNNIGRVIAASLVQPPPDAAAVVRQVAA